MPSHAEKNPIEIENYYHIIDPKRKLSEKERAEEVNRVLVNMPACFPEALRYVMTRFGFTQEALAFESKISEATPHNAIKEKNGEQPTCKQLKALLNLFARQQQIKPSDRVCQRGSDWPMRAGYSLLLFAFASLGIVSFGIEAGASKPQRHVRLWHEPKISHARAA